MSKITFGPGGTVGLGYDSGLEEIKRLGLDSLEVEFTYGVRMSNKEAKRIGEKAKKLGIKLSVHGPYYINLVSEDKAKISASKKRILDSCERGNNLGAYCVVFHAAFYGKHSKEECYELVKKEILDLNETIKKKAWKIMLCPETTGKKSQFGELDELLLLSKETGCGICIDFAHLKARNNGNIDYDDVMNKIKHIKNIHAHFSGINWTEKGERNHEITNEKDIAELLKYIKKYGLNVNIINESPDPFGDSVKSKKVLKKI